jgi:predicted enzyme related to lactoylglutathione lyase
MKNSVIIIIALVSSFILGFVLRPLFNTSQSESGQLKKVTGIGGIFFKCKDPGRLMKWYSDNLGLDIDKYGTSFEWREGANAEKYGVTQWSPFSDSTKYFDPSAKDFMINYRVQNLETLITDLRKSGVTICDSMETYDYGKFVHILDIEGNKIELWEPQDVDYNNANKGTGK